MRSKKWLAEMELEASEAAYEACISKENLERFEKADKALDDAELILSFGHWK
jgi:hypothetical protein